MKHASDYRAARRNALLRPKEGRSARPHAHEHAPTRKGLLKGYTPINEKKRWDSYRAARTDRPLVSTAK